MPNKLHVSILISLLFYSTFSVRLTAQDFLNEGLVFATDQGLFERVNGQTIQIPTAPSTGLFPSISRNGQFLTFSRPDLTNNGLNPSSDLVVVNRASGQQTVLIDNDTFVIGADFDPLSSQVSPNGQFIAFGLRIGPAFGTQLSPTTELQIADAKSGLVISSPFADRIDQLGPTSDALSAEFRGVSFFPNSDSFVTPVLDLIFVPGSAIPDAVTAIVRFDRDQTGQWVPAATLSTPTAVATAEISGIPTDVAVTYQMYPAVSPSGAGIAYFDVFKPTRTGSLTPLPSQSRVIFANSDGSNPQVLTTFNPGFLPTGLTWTADGSQLLVSVSEQVNTGSGFLDLPFTGNSAIFTVSTSTGETNFVSELPNGFAPTLQVETKQQQPEIVTIQGTQEADDIFVSQVGEQILVMVNGEPNGVFDLQNIERLEIFGLKGGDCIEVDAAVPTFISGGNGPDEIFGGTLQNEIRGGAGPDVIFGGPMSDDISGGRGQDMIFALGGDDVVFGAKAMDMIFGGTGNDELSGGSGPDMINGGAGNDNIFGNGGADVLQGQGGNDFLSGDNGPDEIFGGTGDDDLIGGAGFDTLDGGPGNDAALDEGEVETNIEG